MFLLCSVKDFSLNCTPFCAVTSIDFGLGTEGIWPLSVPGISMEECLR